MEKITDSYEIREFTVNIENTNFRFLLDRQREETNGEAHAYILHSHISTEIFACCSGRITLATKKEILTLNSGDIAVVPPGVLHCMHSVDENTKKFVISFICDKRSDRSVWDLYAVLLPFISSKSVSIYHERYDACTCLSEIERLGWSQSKILPALKAVELLIGILENSDKKHFDTTEAKNENGSYDIQRMMKLDCIIGSSYMKELTMKEIASELYISSRQLDRIVRKRYGKTLHKVIMEKRVSVAERMLLTTDMTVEKIGYAVGFSSGAGFYREFVRVYGSTPAEYKKSRSPYKSL